jgi:hypothetical protein
MANAEILHMNKSNEGCLVKVQHICEGETDIAERLDKLYDRLRGVDHSGLDAIPREKVGTGLPTNIDAIARLLARIDQKLSDIEQIF